MSTTLKSQRGFTIIEVIIAIIVLTVGLLGLVTTAALVTRMIARAQRTAVASTFAAQRLERLRTAACIPAQRADGSENLLRGTNWVATNTWRFTTVADSMYRVTLVTRYATVKNRVRADTMETQISCRV